jgi:ABC-type nickel/cobalt efflux system permease component RcnA
LGSQNVKNKKIVMPKVEWNTVASVVVALVIVVALWMLWSHFSGGKLPAGAISKEKYSSLTDAEKAAYQLSADGAHYVKK